MIRRVELPPERVDVLDDLRDEVEAPGQRADVVTGKLEGVEGSAISIPPSSVCRRRKYSSS